MKNVGDVVERIDTPSTARTVSFDDKDGFAPVDTATLFASFSFSNISLQDEKKMTTTTQVKHSPVNSDEYFPNGLEAMLDDPDLFDFASLILPEDYPFQFTLDELERQKVADRTRQIPPQCLPLMSPIVLKKTKTRRRCSEPSTATGPSSWLKNQVRESTGNNQAKAMTTTTTSGNPNGTDHSDLGGMKNPRPRRATCGKANPMTKHKHWTVDEDETLRAALADLGKEKVDWNKIARTHFQGIRSSAQCKSRWKNVSALEG